LKQFPVRFALLVIRVYRFAISPFLGPSCRYTPSCSDYSTVALQRFGFWRGLGLGSRRILRCHPWHAGGFDPVPPAPMTSTTADAMRSAGQG
jgi:putative membrane protein insertion efficiency factor